MLPFALLKHLPGDSVQLVDTATSFPSRGTQFECLEAFHGAAAFGGVLMTASFGLRLFLFSGSPPGALGFDEAADGTFAVVGSLGADLPFRP